MSCPESELSLSSFCMNMIVAWRPSACRPDANYQEVQVALIVAFDSGVAHLPLQKTTGSFLCLDPAASQTQ